MEAMEKNIAVFKKVVLESEYVPFQRRFSKIHKAQCLTVSEDQKSTKRGEGSGKLFSYKLFRWISHKLTVNSFHSLKQ